jgi:hypothetical protein
MITGSIEHNLASLNSALERYAAASGKTMDEVLEKKGRDVGIRIWRGFSEKKFGGPGRKRVGLARAELAARTAAGEGTRVRESLLHAYARQRKQLAIDRLPLLEQKEKGLLSRSGRAALRKNLGLRANLWRATVGREIALRQKGIGVLGASFLWFRARSNQARGRFFVRNKTGRRLGYVEKGEGYLRIVGLKEGIGIVDARYLVVATALAGALADTEVYLARKQEEAFQASLRRLVGLRAA